MITTAIQQQQQEQETYNVFNSETEKKQRDKQCMGERVCAAMEIKRWNDRFV